jgi:hypothetical protein
MIVIPAQAGTQWHQFSVFAIELTYAGSRDNRSQRHWVPACAGMTSRRSYSRFPEVASTSQSGLEFRLEKVLRKRDHHTVLLQSRIIPGCPTSASSTVAIQRQSASNAANPDGVKPV